MKVPEILDNEAVKDVRDILKDIDENLIRNISDRRDNRTDPEIMIVDDDVLSRMLIKNVLSADFDLHIVENGENAFRTYIMTAPDVLFLDIGLPDISGLKVLDILFTLDPDAYIIMFSGEKDKETILEALEFGAYGFVEKPFTRDKLYQYIQQSPTIQNKKIRASAERGFL